MSTILVTLINYIDKEMYDTYARMASKLFRREGVGVISNDDFPNLLFGFQNVDKVVILEFRDNDHMSSVLGSDAYKAAAVYREKAVTVRSLTVQRFERPS